MSAAGGQTSGAVDSKTAAGDIREQQTGGQQTHTGDKARRGNRTVVGITYMCGNTLALEVREFQKEGKGDNLHRRFVSQRKEKQEETRKGGQKQEEQLLRVERVQGGEPYVARLCMQPHACATVGLV